MKLLIEARMEKARQIPKGLERIILIRHADSLDRVKFARISSNDLARPLSKKGKVQSKKIAEFLTRYNKKSPISLVVSSYAKRAKQTIKPFLQDFKGIYKESEAIAPDCRIKGYIDVIERAKSSKILVLVGHQLDFGDFIEYATGIKQNLKFKKGVIVEITRKMDAKNIKGGFVITLFITPDYL